MHVSGAQFSLLCFLTGNACDDDDDASGANPEQSLRSWLRSVLADQLWHDIDKLCCCLALLLGLQTNNLPYWLGLLQVAELMAAELKWSGYKKRTEIKNARAYLATFHVPAPLAVAAA